MELPTEPVAATRQNPRLLTLFGQSKVGKTTALAKLEDCLILDTEKGTDLITALKVNVNSLKELDSYMIALLKAEKKYKYLALDTIDNLVIWFEKKVCKENGVTTIGDIPYGAGFGAVRDLTMTYISRLQKLAPHVILIGHRKKTIIGTETIEVSTSSLDLSGKLKNVLMAECDAIGFVYRSEDSKETMISFESSDELEAGTRCPHLTGKNIPLEWDKIYID